MRRCDYIPAEKQEAIGTPLLSLIVNNARHIRRLPRMLRLLRHSLTYILNDPFYWDEYAREWENSEHDEEFSVLGAEWRHEE